MSPVVADLKPGTEARARIWREGKPHEITVPVSQLEAPTEALQEAPELGHNALGLAVRPLNRDESRQLNVTGGLLVQQSIGPAEQAGIQPGDVVLALNGHALSEAGQLREFTAGMKQHIALLIQRGGARLFVPLDLG